jgi:hypothetical protein
MQTTLLPALRLSTFPELNSMLSDEVRTAEKKDQIILSRFHPFEICRVWRLEELDQRVWVIKLSHFS